MDECQLVNKHKLLQLLVQRKSACRGASQPRSSKGGIVVANAAVVDDVGAVPTTVLGLLWLCFKDMGSIMPSSVLSFSSSMPSSLAEVQGAKLQAKAKTIAHGNESSGTFDNVVTKRWKYEDGGTSAESRATSGRSASTSGLVRHKLKGSLGRSIGRRSKRNLNADEASVDDARTSQGLVRINGSSTTALENCSLDLMISEIRSSERLEEVGSRSIGLARLSSKAIGQSRPYKSIKQDLMSQIRAEDGSGLSGVEAEQIAASPRSQDGRSDGTSTSTFVELLADAAVGSGDSSVVATDCAIGGNGTIDGVDIFSTDIGSGPLANESRKLSVQADNLGMNKNLERVSVLDNGSAEQVFPREQTKIISDAKKSAILNIHKQLSRMTSRKGGTSLVDRGEKIVVRKTTTWRDAVKLPDTIEEVLPVDSKRDPAVYLFLYEKFLEAGRLRDCVAVLESMDEHLILNMKKVNSYEFYSACKKRRALKEAFKFSRLVRRKSLRNFNMLLSVCAHAQDASSACRVLDMVKMAGLQADCIFYTTLISACAKASRIDLMFKFFNEMEIQGIEANVQTFGAMIDGCARAGDVPKAFGIYKKMLNQEVEPDRVIFNTLITACGRAGAFLRAFEVLADMRDAPQPIALDHITYGALIAACSRAGEVERALEVYKRMRSSKVSGTTECYTAAVHACSHKGYLNIALSIYDDMREDGVQPDEVFFCAMMDVAGHAGKIDVAFAILQEMKNIGTKPSPVTYNTLMVACSKVDDAENAMRVYEEIKALGLRPIVPTLNALVASLCAGRELDNAFKVLEELRNSGVTPNKDTYNILLEACERDDQANLALELYNQIKGYSIEFTQQMCDSILGLCVSRVECGAPPLQDPKLLCIKTIEDDLDLHQFWTNQGLVVYDELLSAGLTPTLETVNRVLGCMRVSKRNSRFLLSDEGCSNSRRHNKNRIFFNVEEACSVYLPRALTLYEEARSLGVIQEVDYAVAPIFVDMRTFPIYAVEVGVLVLLKDLKQRQELGLYLNSVKLIFAVEVKEVFTANGGFRRVRVSSRTGQAVKTLLRKLRINYRDYDSVGEVTITNSAIRNWFRAAQRAHQRSVSMQAVETNSSTCSTESLTAVTRPEQRLLHYLPSVESASVV